VTDARPADAAGRHAVPDRLFRATQCHQCQRTLCEVTEDAIRPGQVVAIKCSRCKAMNYLMGRADVADHL
jgi:phage FluMu protein Com